MDVNFNRCKEGLRVIEDIFRFVIEDNTLRLKTRRIRHTLEDIRKDVFLAEKFLEARNAREDMGRDVDDFEKKRKNTSEIFYVNIQRVKESLRVLEEFFKIVDDRKVCFLKKSRYEIYDIEQKAFKKLPFQETGNTVKK